MKKPHVFQSALSSVSGISWPPLATDLSAALAALMHQLEESQWLPPADIVRLQHQQLLQVAAHAERHSAHFRNRLEAAGMRSSQLATAAGMRRLAVMTRREIQAAGNSLFCRQLPETHYPLAKTRTSGSSAEPVVVERSAVNRLFWMAATLREHLWHQRDFSESMAIIRANFPAQNLAERQDSWGQPVNLFYKTGALHAMKLNTDVKEQTVN